MKWLFLLLMVTITNMAAAQPPPFQPPGPPGRDGPRWDPGDRERFRPLSCEEWRRDARRHQCVRVPPRCRYR